MSAPTEFDLAVIGAGSAGLTASTIAARIGLRVAVIERGQVGGDCLWTGCVPSKSLIASARRAYEMRTADRLGLPAADPEINLAQVWKRMHEVRSEIAQDTDNAEYLEDLGIAFVAGDAEFVSPTRIAVADRIVEARFSLVATGSRPRLLEAESLEETGYLTTESVFDIDDPPSSIIIIGAGTAGCELAQAFNRLGIRVTVLEREDRILPRDEADLGDILLERLTAEGVEIVTDAEIMSACTRGVPEALSKSVTARVRNTDTRTWSASEILVAVGETPNSESLGLETLGVEINPSGIAVDQRGRTTVPNIYAAGDVTGRPFLTNAAGAEAASTVRDMFFPGHASPIEPIPWTTFCDPELAGVGITSEQARNKLGERIRVYSADIVDSDRARIDAETCGRIVIVTNRGRIVGGHVLARNASEMIGELTIAVAQKMKLTDFGQFSHTYPSLSMAIGQVGTEALLDQTQRLKWLARRRGGGRPPNGPDDQHA